MPIFDAHVHYSHDAWELVPPKQAVEILRKAGLRGALVPLGCFFAPAGVFGKVLLRGAPTRPLVAALEEVAARGGVRCAAVRRPAAHCGSGSFTKRGR